MEDKARWSLSGFTTIIHLLLTCGIAGLYTWNTNNPYSRFDPHPIIEVAVIAIFIIVMIPLGIPYLFSLLTSCGISAKPTTTEGYVGMMILLALIAGLNSRLFAAILEGTICEIRSRMARSRANKTTLASPIPPRVD